MSAQHSWQADFPRVCHSCLLALDFAVQWQDYTIKQCEDQPTLFEIAQQQSHGHVNMALHCRQGEEEWST